METPLANLPTFPFLERDTLYFHFVTPSPALSRFQRIIQAVQKEIGFTAWTTTHFFVSYNNQIFDRSGPNAIASINDTTKYLQAHYPGYTIDSHASDDPAFVSNFKNLFEHVTTLETPDGQDTNSDIILKISYKSNNPSYNPDTGTTHVLKDLARLKIARLKMSEAEAIRKVRVEGIFTPSNELKNPCYCSHTASELIPELKDQALLRYPAFLHALFAEKSQKFRMPYSRTIIGNMRTHK
jgi:hypothetical protein